MGLFVLSEKYDRHDNEIMISHTNLSCLPFNKAGLTVVSEKYDCQKNMTSLRADHVIFF